VNTGSVSLSTVTTTKELPAEASDTIALATTDERELTTAVGLCR
jgi:hypothetical protein